MEIKLQSTITCPNCGHKKEETMPTDACQYFYECEKCKQVLKPKQGDCCVYCSYGSVACPPIQQDKKCCWQTENKEAQPLTIRVGIMCLKAKGTGVSLPSATTKKFNSKMPLTIAHYEHYLMNFLSGKCTIKQGQYKIHFGLSSVSTSLSFRSLKRLLKSFPSMLYVTFFSMRKTISVIHHFFQILLWILSLILIWSCICFCRYQKELRRELSEKKYLLLIDSSEIQGWIQNIYTNRKQLIQQIFEVLLWLLYCMLFSGLFLLLFQGNLQSHPEYIHVQ